MRINHLSPLYPTDPRVHRAYSEILNIVLLSRHIMDVSRMLIERNVRHEYGSLSGAFPLVFQERLLHTVAKDRIQPPHLFPAEGDSRAFRDYCRKG